MASLVESLKSTWISFSCPICGIENRCRLLEATLQLRVHCRGCHDTIQLVDKDASAAQSFRRIGNAMESFRSALEHYKKEEYGMPLRLPYLKAARVKLQERKNAWIRADYASAETYVAQFLSFAKSGPVIRTIVVELSAVAERKVSDIN